MLESAETVLDWPFPRTKSGCPAAVLAELREEPPSVVRIPAGASESRRAWLITKYPDVRQALMDPRLSADETLPGAPVRIQVDPAQKPGSFLRMDDPEHARLRGLIATEFTARRVRALRPAIQQLIDDLLDELEAHPQPADLQDIFSRKLPTLVIARLLGVPDEDSPTSWRRPGSPSGRAIRRARTPRTPRCRSTWASSPPASSTIRGTT